MNDPDWPGNAGSFAGLNAQVTDEGGTPLHAKEGALLVQAQAELRQVVAVHVRQERHMYEDFIDDQVRSMMIPILTRRTFRKLELGGNPTTSR